MQSVLYRYQY